MNDEYESTPIELTTDPLTTVRVVLSDGYSISGDFLSAVQAQVCEALPYLEPGSTYTADELCGAYLVAQGALPLVRVPGKHEYPLCYRLKTD